MKQGLIGFARQYAAALRTHLAQPSPLTLAAAVSLGWQAADLGREKFELARIHETALAKLDLPLSKNAVTRRAAKFFAEAATPILKTNGTTEYSKIELNHLHETLHRRTVELAAAHQQLRRGVERRQTVESALRGTSQHYAKLLKDSLLLQESLRQMAHRLMAAQEEERRSISRDLRDEIAQTLFGIHVRLLSLKQKATVNNKTLQNEIANTQRVVSKSVKSVRRVAREFGRS